MNKPEIKGYTIQKSIHVRASKLLNHPIEKVWETVAMGFGDVFKYNPALKLSKFDSDKRSGIGTRRHCDFNPKGYIKEEIIDWNEMKSFKLKLTESSMPMGFMESEFIFYKKNGHTELIQDFWYRLKFPMGWMSGFMKSKMQKTLKLGLEGLEVHLTKNN